MPDTALSRLQRLSRTFERITLLGIVLIAGFMVLAVAIPDWTRNLLLSKLGQSGAALPVTLQARVVTAVVLAVPVGVMLHGLWVVRGLFRAFARGEVFTTDAARRLQRFGVTILAQAPLGPLTTAALSLGTTLGNPPGQRLVMLGVGVNDYFALVVGGVLVAAAWVMQEAARLADENASFV